MTRQTQKKILILSNENDPHVDFVEPEIRKRNLDYIRIHPDDFPQKLRIATKLGDHANDILFAGDFNSFSAGQIMSVWYRRPLAPIIHRDIQDPYHRTFAESESKHFIQYLFGLMTDCLWVSDPFKIDDARNKLKQLSLAKELGLTIPDTLATNDSKEVQEFFYSHNGDIIIKSIKNQWVDTSPSKGHVLFTHKLERKDLERLAEVQYAPCLFQEEIKKRYELRITVIGRKIFAAELHSQEKEETKIDWRYDASTIPYKIHSLPPSIADACHVMVRRLGLQFGAIDMIVTPKDEYVFLEINPNGQWAWVEQKTGLPMRESLVDLLQYGKN